MYEKPQYFTPDGFKRLSKNPYKDAQSQRQLLELRKKKALLTAASQKPGPAPGAGISNEAAKLIADVLKGMLHSRGK